MITPIFILIALVLGMFGPFIWLLYANWKLDKPWRDWCNGNIPKNWHCRTYEDYLLRLEKNY